MKQFLTTQIDGALLSADKKSEICRVANAEFERSKERQRVTFEVPAAIETSAVEGDWKWLRLDDRAGLLQLERVEPFPASAGDPPRRFHCRRAIGPFKDR